MGQIDRTDLEQSADAVVRFIGWRQQVGDQERSGVFQYLDEVADAQGDLSAGSAPSRYRAEFERKPLSNDPFWSIRFWSESEFDSSKAGAGWFYRFGKELDVKPWSVEQQRSDLRAFLEQSFGGELNAADEAVVDEWEPMPDLTEALGLSPDGMFVELAVTLGAEGRTIRLEWDFDGSVRQSFPQVLKEAPLPGSPMPDGDPRERLQELDARDSSINVRVDPGWKSELIRESVMAQVVEYLLRTKPRDEPLTRDALDQYVDWTERVAGHPPSPEFEAEAAAMALRSVRPPTAAAHHTYVKRSLRPRGRDVVREAASNVGLSRSAAYQRLQTAGKSAAEFRATADPVGELARFLTAGRPSRFLSDKNRSIRGALIEAGMEKDAARKLESRTRDLDPSERARRLKRASKRAKARGDEA